MEHFVRSSYPGSSRKTLRSLKRQRAGRISELTADKNIPTYVLPLRGEYNNTQKQRCPETRVRSVMSYNNRRFCRIVCWHVCKFISWVTIFQLQEMRQPSSTKETLVNISLRTPLARREDKMPGHNYGFQAFFGNLIFQIPLSQVEAEKPKKASQQEKDLRVNSKTNTFSAVRTYKSSLYLYLYQ